MRSHSSRTDGRVVDAAPTARWAIGKPEQRMVACYRRRGADVGTAPISRCRRARISISLSRSVIGSSRMNEKVLVMAR